MSRPRRSGRRSGPHRERGGYPSSAGRRSPARRRARWPRCSGVASLSTLDGCRLELCSAALGVGDVDRDQIRVDLVQEVERHERRVRAAAIRIDAHRRASTEPRREGDAHDLALLRARSARRPPAREVERLAAVQRRAVAVGLHAGVVTTDLPPAVVRRMGYSASERLVRAGDARRPSNGAGVPSSGSAQRRACGTGEPVLLLVRARPLDTAQGLELLVAHAAMHRRERAQLVPGLPRRSADPSRTLMRSAIALMIRSWRRDFTNRWWSAS